MNIRLNVLASVFCIVSGFVQAQAPKMVLPVGHGSYVRSAEYSSDGKFIVNNSDDGTFKLWDATSGSLLHSVPIRAFEAKISHDNNWY